MSGHTGVGIGSVFGETQPAVTNCDCHIINSATRGVAVGSIEGDCDIYVDKVSLECKLTGSEGVVIGSMSGKKSAASINNSYVLVTGEADKLMCIGSLSSENTTVMNNLSTLNCDFSGKSSAFIGSFAPDAKISITSCTISVNGTSDHEDLFAATEDNIIFSNCKCTAMINGKDKTRIHFDE